MDLLIKTLRTLFDDSNAKTSIDPDGNEYFISNSGSIAEQAEEMCCEYLIGSNGECNDININILRSLGYDVFPGDSDTFGWLTGCIQKVGSNKILVYG